MASPTSTPHLSRQPVQSSPGHYFAAYAPSGQCLGLAATEAAAKSLHTEAERPNEARRQDFEMPRRGKRFLVLKGIWDADRVPESFLDIPPNFAGDSYECRVNERFCFNLNSGLHAVGKFNEVHFRKAETPRGMPWAILVELGTSWFPAEGVVELGPDGAGVVEVCDTKPVRIVVPAEVDLSRFLVDKRVSSRSKPPRTSRKREAPEAASAS